VLLHGWSARILDAARSAAAPAAGASAAAAGREPSGDRLHLVERDLAVAVGVEAGEALLAAPGGRPLVLGDGAVLVGVQLLEVRLDLFGRLRGARRTAAAGRLGEGERGQGQEEEGGGEGFH